MIFRERPAPPVLNASTGQFRWRLFQLAVLCSTYPFFYSEWRAGNGNPESLAPIVEATLVALLATVAVSRVLDWAARVRARYRQSARSG